MRLLWAAIAWISSSSDSGGAAAAAAAAFDVVANWLAPTKESACLVRSSSVLEAKSVIMVLISCGRRSNHRTRMRSIGEVEPSGWRVVDRDFISRKAAEGLWSPRGSLTRSIIFLDRSSGVGEQRLIICCFKLS